MSGEEGHVWTAALMCVDWGDDLSLTPTRPMMTRMLSAIAVTEQRR